ncbi:MAG: ATP-binding protein [Geobacter sp.]|nr:ATP-binding protein [Geobacter sp.]
MTPVADQAQLEQQLLESEQRYQAFTELSSDFCHVCTRFPHAPWRVQWIGGQFERITGYGNDELLALGCWLPLVHPDDRERVGTGLLKLAAGDEVCTEFRLVRKDQTVRWIREHSRCVQDPSGLDLLRLYGSARDITAAHESTLALQAAENAYRTIFNATNDVIFIMDTQLGMLIDCNKQALQLFGRLREELIGSNPVQLSPPDHPIFSFEQAQVHIQSALEGEAQLFEWLCARADGTTFWAEVSLRAAEINGRQRLLAVVRDISERKQGMLELQQARDAALQATVAKNEFLANMSHEVRTPLNGIMGLSQLLRTTNLTEEQAGYMDMLDGSSRNLLALINDILDISRIEAGSLAIQQTPFSLVKLLREVAAMYEKPAAEKGIDLTIQLPDDLPPALVGDPLRLKQVLNNLVGNAIKFTSHGGVSVHIVRLHDSTQGSRLRFEVQDSGIGMSPKTLQKIFQPFTQADASTARNHGGSGLGLAICRRLSELMGGSICVESSLGQGSCFVVELPFGRYAGDQAADDAQPAASIPQLDPLEILLVEDQEVNRTFVQRLLERQGHRIIPAADGLMALDLLDRQPYDLMLLDIQMPGMGGDEVLARLRQSEQASGLHLPVIALTAHALAGDKEKLLKSGFDGYISKPVQMDHLTAEMGRVVAVKGTFHT